MSSLLGGYWNSSLLGGVRKRRRVGVRRSLGMGVRRHRRYRGRGLSGVGLSGVGLSGVGMRRRRRVSKVSGSARGRALRYRVKSGGAIYASGRRRVHLRRRISGSAYGFGRRRVYNHRRMMGSAYGKGRRVSRHVSLLQPAKLLLNRYKGHGMILPRRLGMRSRTYGSRLSKPRMRQHRYAHRRASPAQMAYRNFVRSHIRSAPGSTAAQKMRHVAQLWKQSH